MTITGTLVISLMNVYGIIFYVSSNGKLYDDITLAKTFDNIEEAENWWEAHKSAIWYDNDLNCEFDTDIITLQEINLYGKAKFYP